MSQVENSVTICTGTNYWTDTVRKERIDTNQDGQPDHDALHITTKQTVK